ncbi:MAG: DUF5103 domain-containing protein [Flavobacteriales bacterium]|nr:DUF5103 domain-containing protein [Flavobacteriales bacterium]
MPLERSGAPADEYYKAQDVITPDAVLSPTIRKVECFKTGFALAPPLIELGTEETITLRFDDLQDQTEALNYRVVHCTWDWKPSGLGDIETIEGTPSEYVPTPRQSFTTRQPYLQYSIVFPNRMMRPKLSGNHLIIVYRDGDPNDIVLTRRMMILQRKATVDARVVACRDVEKRDTHQQVDLTLRHPGLEVRDPFGDLQVVVLQNMRWDDARTGLRPKFVRDTELVYDHPAEALFAGGNEWRNMDLKNLRYARPPVQRIGLSEEGLDQATLQPEPKRNIRVYTLMDDINGRHFVLNDQVEDEPLAADYCMVEFNLPQEAPLSGGDMYVYGGFADFQLRRELRMTWVPEQRAYRLRTLIKQGFIDYQFAVLPNGRQVPDLTTIEGSHFQTENDYVVLVYVKDYQARCDRLVGVRFLNSRRG